MTSRHRLAELVAAAPADLVLPGGDRRAPVDVAGPLTLLDALDLGDGRWLAVVDDADDGRWTVPLMASQDRVRRAVAGDGVAESLVRRMAAMPSTVVPAEARRHDGRSDALRTVDRAGPGLDDHVDRSVEVEDTRATHDAASPSPERDAFALEAWHVEGVRGERAVTVDQTNESVVVGERAVVKYAVRLPADGHAAQPSEARLRTLMAQGFTGTPRPWGLATYADPADGRRFLLATVAEYLPGALDGWDWAVDDVRRLARGEASMEEAVAPAARLGELTARLHVALASAGRDAADDRTVARWTTRAYDDLDAAVQLVDGPEGERLRARAGRIAVAFGAFRECVGTPLVDVHGDLHVGQVLRHGHPAEYAVTDFDGNPVLAPEERSARQPAALDAAGMLASLDHVGRVVVHRTDGVDPGIVRDWIAAAQVAYLDAYRTTLEQLGCADLLDERLLAPFRLQQECREFLYAVHHLPHWRYVPDAALCDLLPDEE